MGAPTATESEATAAPNTQDATTSSAEAPEPSPPEPDTTPPSVVTATTAEDVPATSPHAIAAELEPEALETTTQAEAISSMLEHDPVTTAPLQENTISVEVEGEVVVATLAAADDIGQTESTPNEPQSIGSTDSSPSESETDRKPTS